MHSLCFDSGIVYLQLKDYVVLVIHRYHRKMECVCVCVCGGGLILKFKRLHAAIVLWAVTVL